MFYLHPFAEVSDSGAWSANSNFRLLQLPSELQTVLQNWSGRMFVFIIELYLCLTETMNNTTLMTDLTKMFISKELIAKKSHLYMRSNFYFPIFRVTECVRFQIQFSLWLFLFGLHLPNDLIEFSSIISKSWQTSRTKTSEKVWFSGRSDFLEAVFLYVSLQR